MPVRSDRPPSKGSRSLVFFTAGMFRNIGVVRQKSFP